MELHKALKEIITQRGVDMINNIQIVNFLLDYQAFKEKPATKLILRDVINAGYGESILSLKNTQGWQTKFKQYEYEFIDSCGYKEELAAYVFESIAYALGMSDSRNEEPTIKPSFNVDSFFDIPEVEVQQPATASQNSNKQSADPTDLYTIALSFYNEGKYQQSKGFIEKAINTQPNSAIPSNHLRLLGDILMRIGDYEEAVKCYNECFTQKANEERCTIDQLRESLKQHTVKGFENIMFFYFFCLYAAKRMNDAQWLHFVKGEARSGLIDAIRFCADYGINPVEYHTDIYFTDIKQLRGGDFLYDDGSFAHEKSGTKKIVANIVLTETSTFEKTQGWTHGYIIPLETADGIFGRKKYSVGTMGEHLFKWSVVSRDLPFPHAHYTIDDLNHWSEMERIESEPYIRIQHYDDYPAFEAVKDFQIKMPLLNASPWFLPSIHCLKRIRRLPIRHINSIWTSTQADEMNAVCFSGMDFRIERKTKGCLVLPIAAF